MKDYKRIFVIVLDSLGIGAMPDSPKFGESLTIKATIFIRGGVTDSIVIYP